ncbi:ATP synthase F0 subcomplex B subunit [Lachnospiraceae bacterium YSD2013]|nr:F0F1 ATP synthase subunit B [Lachnospiraceae bacterium]SCX11143.1 ATP synthase F0 subcomplex B subunit [Lachnospiraceae bacterium YSD2013]
MKVQDLVTIDPWTLIAQLLNLFIQVMLIKKFLFKPIREVLAKRKALADAELADAAKAKEEAESLKSEYEESMKQARDKANDILNTAQKSASQQSEEIIREANAQAVSIKAKAERDIEQERRKAVNEIKDEIGDMAMEIAGKVIGREINSSDHEKLIDDFINKVGEES